MRFQKTRCHLLQNWLNLLCFLCPSIAVVVVAVGRGWCFDFVAIVVVGGAFAVFLCAHTHSFIVVILLVWFRLFAVSFRIDKVFRPCSLCGSQGLMTARGSRGRRGWLLLLVGISGLRFS